jgi:hypothetical protein
VKLILVATTLVLGVVILGAAYYRVGWSRMESECGANPPGAPDHGSVAFSWSWKPVGFHCSYEDGSEKTSLWF